MNAGQSIREAVAHGFAAAVVIALSVSVAVVGYVGVLAWAVLAGLPIGGPLALPFMMLFALASSTLAVIFGLFSATAIAHYLCRRRFHWPLFAEIPVSTLLTVGASVSITVVVGMALGVPAATSVAQGAILTSLLLVPLGVYWWVLTLSNWGLEHGQRMIERVLARPASRITRP